MKALIVNAPGQVSLQEVPLPRMGRYDCLVKIEACAICTGTDSDIIAGTFPWLNPYPLILGHEATGLIVEVGDGVRRFRHGQRVTRPQAIYSGESRAGLHSNWGGYAEYGLVRDVEAAAEQGIASPGDCRLARNPLPEGLDPVSAALSVNQREILSVARKLGLDLHSVVVVIGSGYNGLLFALLCKHFGAQQVVMLGNPRLEERARSRFQVDAFIDYREEQAVAHCLDFACARPTHLIDAVGSFASLALAEQILQPGTAFGCYGVRDFAATQELRQRLAQTHPALDMTTDEPGCVVEWYQLWKDGFFAQPGMCDDVLPLAEHARAFDLLARRQAVKIVLTM